MTPESPLTIWKVAGFKQTLDYDNRRMRTEQIRTAQFPFALASVADQSLSVDHDVAWNKTDGQISARLSDQAAHDRQLEMLRHPVTILRAALDPASKLSNLRQQENHQAVDITTAAGLMVTLAMDPGTHLPLSVTSLTDQPNLGDVAVETTFADYQDVGGLKLPMQLTTKVDKWVQSDIRVSRYTLNPNAGDLAASSAMKSALAAPAVAPVDVKVEQIAKGIWWLAGTGNHRSVAFEFADHLTLFELPESEARARAVIERAHSLKFGKPLTEVIISHHHFDHSAGLRVAVAEGLTIITYRSNLAFFKDLAGRKHTLIPDPLARNPTAQAIKLKAVDDELVLKDSAMELDLYHVKDNSHTDTLLMGWVPAEGILVQADLYDSGWPKQPWADNLIHNVELRKLRPQKDVPIHGEVQPWTEVLQTLKQKGQGK